MQNINSAPTHTHPQHVSTRICICVFPFYGHFQKVIGLKNNLTSLKTAILDMLHLYFLQLYFCCIFFADNYIYMAQHSSLVVSTVASKHKYMDSIP